MGFGGGEPWENNSLKRGGGGRTKKLDSNRIRDVN